MGRRKEIKVEPSTYRAMIEKFPYKQMTIDFNTKEEALQYVHELTSDNTAWYGVYELNPKCEYLISVENKRLRPYDDTIPIKAKQREKPSCKVKRK